MNGLNISAALSVARKDIKTFLKERGTLLYLFVVPLVFMLTFSGAGSFGNKIKEQTIGLPVVNLDHDSQASETLLEALEQAGIQCQYYEQDNAAALLEKGKIKRLLTIPTGYAADLENGKPVTLSLVNSPNASASMTEAVYRMVAGVTADLSLQTQLIASFRQMADMQASAPPQQQAFNADIIIEQAESQFARAKTAPLLGIEQSWPENLLEDDKDEINDLSLYVPGFAVLFIFLTAQATAQSIYEEKKMGSFRRLQAAPISKAAILIGKLTPNFITGLAQIIVLFGVGVLVFPLLGIGSMTLGKDPLALVVVCLVVLLCSTSLGVLIAAIARSEGQIGGMSAVVLWVLGFAAILFTSMPLNSTLETISKLIPHFWANAAFQDLFLRGQGLTEVMPSVLPLLGFTAVFFAIGLWRFKFD